MRLFGTTTRLPLHTMHITILTFEGFNELDSLVAFGILNRVKKPGWRVSIACPSARVRSMNGVVIEAQATLHDASRADVVIAEAPAWACIGAALPQLPGQPPPVA